MMKFETIKENARKIFVGTMGQWDRGPLTGFSPLMKATSPAFTALLPFVLASRAERSEMREFASAFEASEKDWLANAANAKHGEGLDSAWNQVVLRAREAGVDLINNWDVRQVGKLIDLFPEAVPQKYRGVELTCYMADNEDCDWVVEVVEKKIASFKNR